MRFYLQYSATPFITGGPFADEVEPTSTGTLDVSNEQIWRRFRHDPRPDRLLIR